MNSIMKLSMSVRRSAPIRFASAISSDLDVRFDRRVLEGTATLQCDRLSGDELILDTRGLAIHGVDHCAGYDLGPAHPGRWGLR